MHASKSGNGDLTQRTARRRLPRLDSSRKHRPTIALAALGVMGGAFALAACDQGEAQSPETATCETDFGRPGPPLTSPSPPTEPATRPSHVTVNFTMDEKWLVDEIEKEVPVRLASAKRQSIGAPGRVTYVVKRGKPRIEVKSGELNVHVPIHADVEVCKPIGSMCLRYGACRPEFTATVSVPTKLRKDYALPPARMSLVANRKCVIGIDVTPQILSQARRDVKRVEQRINRSMPDVKSHVKRAMAELGQPREIPRAEDVGPSAEAGEAAPQCVRFTPSGVEYTLPTLAKKQLAMQARVAGRLERTACDDAPKNPKAPAPEIVGTLTPESTVYLSSSVSIAEMAPALERGLRGPVETDWAISSVELVGDGKHVLLGTDLEGKACGRAWVPFQPEGIVAGDSIGVVFRPEAVASDDTRGEIRGLLGKSIASRGALTLATVPALTETHVPNWIRQLQEQVPNPATFRSTFDPTPIEIDATRSALHVTQGATGSLFLHLGTAL